MSIEKLERPPMGLDDLLHDREAQADASRTAGPARVEPDERLDHLLQPLRGYARTVVLDLHDDDAVADRCPHHDRFAELASVIDQIGDGPRNRIRPAKQADMLGAVIPDEGTGFLELVAERRKQRTQIDPI